MNKWLLALLIAFLATGCNLLPDREVILVVQKIEGPATAAAGAPFTVIVTVQTGGCLRFDRFSAVRSAADVQLTARGRDSEPRQTVCTADIRFEPHAYVVQPPFQSPFFVVAIQPDGSTLPKQVFPP
ncbi:MAG TPA: hypothetical protein VNJ04_16930 [Gemmatimonadaceae bacterium]|nr:hypothetical protein [Gemmatimonadaceae bacterium]